MTRYQISNVHADRIVAFLAPAHPARVVRCDDWATGLSIVETTATMREVSEAMDYSVSVVGDAYSAFNVIGGGDAMYINFFDTYINGPSSDAILEGCRKARPRLAPELSLVDRPAPGKHDVHAMRGAVHTGLAVFDGEAYWHIWS